jgi:hypothetical protein
MEKKEMAMESHRVKIKIGDFEFESEGPPDVVQAQFQAFQQMISSVPSRPVAPHEPNPGETGAEGTADKQPAPQVDATLPKIMRIQGRVVSLTARPKGVDDAVLLLLYGQKILRDNESVTGGEIVDGLTITGGMNGERSDRLMERAVKNGDVISIGERRAKRYRLNNTGVAKARQIASDLIATVA